MNRLSSETSPYLLQHANNPVDWYPWGDEALERARTENKPILVSIGYAACHWCHVMERESFENEATAAVMNEHFINIKIDREERPDLDHIYMDAVQAMTGSGGWPLNVFLTPDGKPFYGGTYFPPIRMHIRPSWEEVLMSVSRTFKEKRNEIDAQAENLTAHLLLANDPSHQLAGGDDFFSMQTIEEAKQNILKSADTMLGGFGNAPKFPQTFSIAFLLRSHFVNNPGDSAQGKSNVEEAGLKQALLSLDKMIDGGIYDQLGGGFARYSTDAEWLAPHFEKMLYDNALLVDTLAEAYSLTGREEYRRVISQTIELVERELMHPEGGFYSALDADSEGEEGRFYVWKLEEVKEALGNDWKPFAEYYDVTKGGNWEGTNILRVKKRLEEFSTEKGHDKDKLASQLEKGRKKLMEVRSQRIRPLLDDKQLLGWNALMNSACTRAYAAIGDERYLELAERNMNFILDNFLKAGVFRHTWKGGVAKYPAFLDDHAFLIRALIQLQEVTGERLWLTKALEIARTVIAQFSDEDSQLFYYTPIGQKDVILRKKEIYDGALPSGNAVMAANLYRLSIYFDLPEWRERSMGMVKGLGRAIAKYPTSFGVWASLLQEMVAGTYEIAVVGKDHEQLMGELHRLYLPHKVLMGSETGDDEFPLLRHKNSADRAFIFLCRNYSCEQPVVTISRFISLINNDEARN